MINFSKNLTIINCKWQDFKNFCTLKGMNMQCYEEDNFYIVFAFDEPLCYLTNIYKNPDLTDGYEYTVEQATQDLNEFTNIYLPFVNKPLTPRDSEGRPRVSIEKTSLFTREYVSINLCDKCTWFQSSKRVVDEIATRVDGYRYDLSHNFIIDSFHGRITWESRLNDGYETQYRVIIKKNNNILTEQDPHYETGGDYIINYNDGYIQFLNEINENDEIKASYWYAFDSSFIVAPDPGKTVHISMIECQFTNNIIMNDSIVFTIRGLVDVFAPELVPYLGSGTKIPLRTPTVYKTVGDLIGDAKRAYPLISPIGGSGWRGLHSQTQVFNFDIEGEVVLDSKYGMELEIKLEHDNAFYGDFATTTFYCRITDG
jgi:hypothetical protein